MAGSLLSDIFGPDPDVFRPERWLEAGSTNLAQMERVHELVFGHGATRCLGIRIATMTLNKVFVEVWIKLILGGKLSFANPRPSFYAATKYQSQTQSILGRADVMGSSSSEISGFESHRGRTTQDVTVLCHCRTISCDMWRACFEASQSYIFPGCKACHLTRVHTTASYSLIICIPV